MYKKAKIIFFCMVFVVGTTFSQNQSAKPEKLLLLQTTSHRALYSSYLVKIPGYTPSIKPIIAPDYYVTQLGFFCKQEIKFEKTTKVPFRFRLGSVEDCDRLEGKQKAPDPKGGQNAINNWR